jgi:hypothetical protein
LSEFVPSVCRHKIFLCVGDELRVAWMVDRFDANDKRLAPLLEGLLVEIAHK